MASVNKRKWTHNGVEKEAWAVRYFDEKGKHRQRTFEKKKDADVFKRKAENEIADGSHIAKAESITVKALCELYVRWEESRMRDGIVGKSHHRRVCNFVDNGMTPFIGHMIAHDVQSGDVEDWFQKLRTVRGLAPDTARDRVGQLSRIYEFGIRRKILKTNPVPAANRQLRGITRNSIRTFTPEQVTMLLKHAEERRFFQHLTAFKVTRITVNIAAFCGLRHGEIMALTVGHIDFDKRVIEVRHNLTEWDELKTPKTAAGIRDVPLPDHIAVMIREWLRDYYKPNDRHLLFRTPKGKQIDSPSFHASYWRPLLQKAGLENNKNDRFHFHALRHFAASNMIAHGLPLMDVASLLGHKKFDTTLQVYAHSMVGGKRRSELFDEMAAGMLRGDTPALALPV